MSRKPLNLTPDLSLPPLTPAEVEWFRGRFERAVKVFKAHDAAPAVMRFIPRSVAGVDISLHLLKTKRVLARRLAIPRGPDTKPYDAGIRRVFQAHNLDWEDISMANRAGDYQRYMCASLPEDLSAEDLTEIIRHLAHDVFNADVIQTQPDTLSLMLKVFNMSPWIFPSSLLSFVSLVVLVIIQILNVFALTYPAVENISGAEAFWLSVLYLSLIALRLLKDWRRDYPKPKPKTYKWWACPCSFSALRLNAYSAASRRVMP